MKKTDYIVLVLLCVGLSLQAQIQISGHFPGHASQPVSLSVYKGFERMPVATGTVDSLGNFRLACPAGYRGVAFLQVNNADGIEMIVNREENFGLKGTTLMDINNLTCTGNEATTTLYNYYRQQIAREKALAGWRYLQKMYSEDPYLKNYNKVGAVNGEIHFLEQEGVLFINAQPAGSYPGWYLPLVTFVRDIPVSVQRCPERIPQHIDFFMHTDFSDGRFYNSGLLPLITENYYFMLENSGKSLDSMYVEMNRATDYILGNLRDKRPEWLQEAALFLFKLFEKRSLFPAAEHLSTVMLTQSSCVLDSKVSARFEGYRAMKKGNRAPDIDFRKAAAKQSERNDKTLNQYLRGYASLSAIKSRYKLVIFGFADCAECKLQLPQVKQMYPDLKKRGVEVLYVSLDTDKAAFESVAADSPWVSYFDYGGWDSRVATDYHVFASPTMYLLGEKQEILYKIISPQHLEAVMKVVETKKETKE